MFVNDSIYSDTFALKAALYTIANWRKKSVKYDRYTVTNLELSV